LFGLHWDIIAEMTGMQLSLFHFLFSRPRTPAGKASMPVAGGFGFHARRLEPAHAGCYGFLRGIRREPDHYFSEREESGLP
jgi:hypothetical protein